MTKKRQTVVEVKTGRSRLVLDGEPVVSSAPGPWTGLLIEHHAPGQRVELRDVAPVEHIVAVNVGGLARFEWYERGRFRTVDCLPGDAVFLPAGVSFSARANSSAEVLMVALEPSFLRYAAHDLVSGVDRLELRQSIEIRDPMLQALGASLRAEMAADYSGGRVYGETLASTLAVYLVRHYGEGVKLESAAGQGLNRQQLRRATEFIAENLSQNVSLEQIAAAAGLSAFHFARLFKKSTGIAPHQYVIRCRVERARQLMLTDHVSMADIAQQVGFCDQSHLTTHFKRAFGVTPRVFRRRAMSA